LSVIYARSQDGALRQGEIITDMVQIRLDVATIGRDHQQIEEVVHPIVVVLSQDCDLDQDWKKRRTALTGNNGTGEQLPDILFVQVQEAIPFRGNISASTKIWDRIKNNKDERYHFLEAVAAEDDAIQVGLPELGIDFKRYFTVPAREVYVRIEEGARKRCRLTSPYLEHLSTRFYYYQFRVALPADHQSVS
jgi:hypothetical protein